ncbi:sulfite exporter TauE/SafE family protein [Aliiglaciecola sp. LCG003]|uniref:sulfite exporter TauE/SafE family protein n=1 Tax=Aliiglaciecola sp. LCG003 TaxID=3053655 RepID=UPI0025733355|nr:sulfite exporter TauE/SafE family protein [Aliiglaciecola sp. LCG003]WJG08228.1 sulfite exporter TauE/SafE family protein [Aliiglaciecola sp. LCG003]
MLHHLCRYPLRYLLALCWLIIIIAQGQPLTLIVEYGAFSLLGMLGAVFANATGAGGGVVFVPFFQQLQFDPNTTIATSFAIQCCGMTAGAVTWWKYFSTQQGGNKDWQELGLSLKLAIPSSVLGILLAQGWQLTRGTMTAAEHLHTGFGVFSILLALAIFASIPLLKKLNFKQSLDIFDIISICIIGLLGGAITAYLSIGVGELLAVFLIMRRFNVTFAIATAVIVSAFSVWAAVVNHLVFTQAVYWPIVLFAGAGAIVGGILAKQLVMYFSATNLKVFFAGWVLILGVFALPL